jgi:GNAT superfamily N-acetyltransferase
MAFTLRPALSATDVEVIRNLFLEYQSSLGITLCFQDFGGELATLPGAYAPPKGRLYLAAADGTAMGCIGLKPFKDATAEMKRLYVRPAHRGKGIGRELVMHIIQDAKEIGYHYLVLDTLPSMIEAQALYAQLGFVETTSYTFNPLVGTRYLQLTLNPQIA